MNFEFAPVRSRLNSHNLPSTIAERGAGHLKKTQRMADVLLIDLFAKMKPISIYSNLISRDCHAPQVLNSSLNMT